MSQETRSINRNPKQRAFLDAILNNYADFSNKSTDGGRSVGKYQGGFQATFQGGRGSGKTFTLLDIIAISAYQLPCALAGIGSRTFKQVQEIILSQSHKVWSQWGLSEYDSKNNPYGNYVVNKRPPSHFKKPLTSPKTFENAVSFASGYCLISLSADRPDTQRGLNLDQYFGDESAFTKREFITKTIRPAVRANKYVYHDHRRHRKGYNHPLHWLIAHFSSAPYSIEGMWIYENEEKMNAEILEVGGYKRYLHLEATAYDNIEFLPGDYIEQQKQDLTPFEFDVEIMNKRVKKHQNAFYPAFNPDVHAKDYYIYNFDDQLCRTDIREEAYNSLKPLEISWDFNGYFTSAIIAQDFDKEFRFIKEFWAKESNSSLVDAVCDKIIEHYQHHLRKTILLYGDAGGNVKSAGTSESFFAQIKTRLRIAGWQIIDCTESTYPPFKQRYQVINALLAEGNTRLPKLRFNVDGCKSLIVSIQNTQTIKDSFEKNKKEEGKLHIPQESVTHLSDAFDYIIYKKFASSIEAGSSRGGMLKLHSKS